MSCLLKIMLLAILLSDITPAQAQLLTIQDAVAQAIQNNPQLNQMRSRLKQKKEEWRTQTGISAPEISFMREGMNNKAADPFQEQRLTVSQTIDFPLTTSFRLKAINEEVKGQQLLIQSEERRVKAEVKSRYIEVNYALGLQKLRNEQMRLSTDLYEAVRNRVESGKGNEMDLTKAELQLAEANNEIDDVRRQLHLARYGLFNLMGLSSENQKYTILFSDSLRSDNVEISQIQALAVLTNLPSYQSSERELAASGYLLKEVKSNILPDIRFNIYKEDYGTGYNFNGIEIGLSFPIWFPFEQRGLINTTLARQGEIRWKQQEIRLDMKKQIEFAWHSYEVSRSTIKRYNETINKKAEMLQSLAMAAYKKGEIDLLELINSQQIYLGIQEHYLSAMSDFQIQLAELEKFLDRDLVY